MKNFGIILTLLAFTLLSCNSKNEVDVLIDELKEVNTLDKVKINEFISSVDTFIVNNPNSSKSPNYLELKAKYLTALGKHQESLVVYDNIYKKFTTMRTILMHYLCKLLFMKTI